MKIRRFIAVLLVLCMLVGVGFPQAVLAAGSVVVDRDGVVEAEGDANASWDDGGVLTVGFEGDGNGEAMPFAADGVQVPVWIPEGATTAIVRHWHIVDDGRRELYESDSWYVDDCRFVIWPEGGAYAMAWENASGEWDAGCPDDIYPASFDDRTGTLRLYGDPGDGEAFLGFSVYAGSMAVDYDYDRPEADIRISYHPLVAVANIGAFYSVDGWDGLPPEAAGRFEQYQDTKLVDGPDGPVKLYDTSEGLHTDKTVTAAGGDGRTFSMELEAWNAEGQAPDVGMVLDSSGSMSFAADLPERINAYDVIERLRAEGRNEDADALGDKIGAPIENPDAVSGGSDGLPARGKLRGYWQFYENASWNSNRTWFLNSASLSNDDIELGYPASGFDYNIVSDKDSMFAYLTRRTPYGSDKVDFGWQRAIMSCEDAEMVPWDSWNI